MNVWCRLPTIFNRRNILRYVGFLAVCVAITTTLLFASLTHAAAGINKTLSFQGRLLGSSGAVVPDGHYNIQFKIYQDGSGTTAGDTGGSLKWTETYINNGGTSGVEVKDGFFSVELGSQNPFGTNVDWNQDTLWLSMNIAGNAAGCTTFNSSPCVSDGEMLPMKRITATPYALNSGMLGGITSAGFLQNTTAPQTADFNITGAGIANTLQGLTSITAPSFDTTAAGTLSIGTVNATSIDIGTNNSAHTIAIGTGTGTQVVTLGSTDSASQTLVNAGSAGIQLASAGGITIDSGTSLTVNGATTFNQGVNSAVDYSINGVTALNDTALTFAGASTSTVSSASAQSLNLNGSTGVTLVANGASSASFSDTNVQIGTGGGSGSATTLTLDKSSAAPTGSVGSMYYDTSLGEVQCYEASGWGNCSAAPDNFVSLSPTYANAVVHPTGTGTLNTDLCSDALNINDGTDTQPTICGAKETYNYYNWTSPSTTDQTRSIYVTYQLPSTFKEFVANSTSLMGRTDGADGKVGYQIYKNNVTDGLTACGSAVDTSTGSQTTWQKGAAATTADPSNCDFAAGDSIVFKIDLTSANDANAYASTLNFAFSNNN